VILFSDLPARALAVFAHPDDPEVACGGTLARWAAGGAEVRLVVVNAGDKGALEQRADGRAVSGSRAAGGTAGVGSGRDAGADAGRDAGAGAGGGEDPDELTRLRAGEVHAAAAVLGLAGVDLLGLPDGEVTNDLDLRRRLVELVRRHQPDVVICPDPTAVFFGDTYVNHRDHREVGWATVDAVAPAVANPLYFPDAGEPHQPATLLLSGTFSPDAWVDVSDVVETKIRAVACHESRMGGEPDLVAELLRARTAEAGAEVGVAHAESFRRVRFG
jgi:LmbE family N-acetylglucosaminyl deacetylase